MIQFDASSDCVFRRILAIKPLIVTIPLQTIDLTLCLHAIDSQVAAHILPVGDPAMLITVNLFSGNVFYIVRRAKLAWLHLVQP